MGLRCGCSRCSAPFWWAPWLLATVLIALCGLTFLPGSGILAMAESTRWLVLLFRVPGTIALLCLLSAAVVFVWWPLLLVSLAIGAVLWFREARRRRKRSGAVAAALPLWSQGSRFAVEPRLAVA